MNKEPRKEFDIALNIMGLSPRDPTYWRERFWQIRADLANVHGIQADGWVGSYVADPNIGYRPFYLFAKLLDLDTKEGLTKYHEVEAAVEGVIKKYIK